MYFSSSMQKASDMGARAKSSAQLNPYEMRPGNKKQGITRDDDCMFIEIQAWNASTVQF